MIIRVWKNSWKRIQFDYTWRSMLIQSKVNPAPIAASQNCECFYASFFDVTFKVSIDLRRAVIHFDGMVSLVPHPFRLIRIEWIHSRRQLVQSNFYYWEGLERVAIPEHCHSELPAGEELFHKGRLRIIVQNPFDLNDKFFLIANDGRVQNSFARSFMQRLDYTRQRNS